MHRVKINTKRYFSWPQKKIQHNCNKQNQQFIRQQKNKCKNIKENQTGGKKSLNWQHALNYVCLLTIQLKHMLSYGPTHVTKKSQESTEQNKPIYERRRNFSYYLVFQRELMEQRDRKLQYASGYHEPTPIYFLETKPLNIFAIMKASKPLLHLHLQNPWKMEINFNKGGFSPLLSSNITITRRQQTNYCSRNCYVRARNIIYYLIVIL